MRPCTLFAIILVLLPIVAVQLYPKAAAAAHLEAKYGKPSAIDGSLDDRAWKSADSLNVRITLPSGKTENAELKVLNDNKNIYISFRFPVPENLLGQSLFFRFDDENTGTFDEGQDVIGMNPDLGSFRLLDQVRTSRAPCNPPQGKPRPGYCGMEDTKFGGTLDGAGAYQSDKRHGVYEFSHPLKSRDRENDIQLNPGDTFGIRLSLRLIESGANYPNGYGDTYFPDGGFVSIELARR